MEMFTNAAQELAQKFVSFVLSLQFWDILDILVITFLIYHLLLLVRRSNASRLLKGVLFVIVALWFSTDRLKVFNYLLSFVVEWGVLAMFILFQPEIRRILEQMGSSSIPFLDIFKKPPVGRQIIENAIEQTVSACGDMSKSRTGALIVFERHIQLDDALRSGTKLDAEVSSELLKNCLLYTSPSPRDS